MERKENMNDIKDKVSKRILKRLRDLNLSQKDLGSRVGSTPSTVNDWVKGRNIPGGLKLLKVCKTLNCSPEWLLAGEGSVIPKGSNASSSLPGVWESQLHPEEAGCKVPELKASGEVDTLVSAIVMSSALQSVSSPSAVAFTRVSSDASAPLIRKGDIVLVDTSSGKEGLITSGEHYAFAVGSLISVYQVFVGIDGKVSVQDKSQGGSSTNIELDQVKILGHVFYRIGAL